MDDHTDTSAVVDEIDEIDEIADRYARPDTTLREWWQALAAAGLSFPDWPAPWGRGWTVDQVRQRSERFGELGLVGPPPGLGTLMGGPVVIEHGTDDQRSRWLSSLADGTTGWCQLFSEPGAGSDLAGLTTTAERDGDDWVVTGQKVWTSGATFAAAGMLVARTNWDVPKHRGLTYFVIEMDQPGVEIRPLEQMNGASHFSEVFLDEARVADADRVGDVGSGWALATATLGYERRGLGAATVPGPRPEPGRAAGNLDRTLDDIWEEFRSRAGDDVTAIGAASRLAALAGRRHHADESTRQRLAELVTLERIEPPTARRQPLVAKLAWTERLRHASALTSHALGADGMLADAPPTRDQTGEPTGIDPVVRDAAGFVLSVPSASIAGGTDEIQRNIIGERALGLPREPAADRDRPFREVPRNA